MKVRAFLALSTFLVTPLGLAKAQALPGDQSASLRISEKTEVPGSSLSPGTYNIRIADHLSDRIIIQIRKNGSGSPALLLAYPNSGLASNGTGPITFPSGLKNKPTLRGYAFSGGPVVEFVYPKKDAVTLAKANDVRVMAVDPASENLPKLPQLTSTDMNEVTLWMLTPTPVQPGDSKPGIQAARYQAPAQAGSQPAEQAQSSAPATPASAYRRPTIQTRSAVAPPIQMASNEHPRLRPPVKQLPHTASDLPLISLVGCLSLLLASALGVRRRLTGAQV